MYLLTHISTSILQVYLVTGGLISFLNSDSTELLVHGTSSWTSSAPLPSPRSSLRAVTLGNKIVATGVLYKFSVLLFLLTFPWQGVWGTGTPTNMPHSMIFLSLTRRSWSGKRLDQCQLQDMTMLLQQSIISPLWITVMEID